MRFRIFAPKVNFQPYNQLTGSLPRASILGSMGSRALPTSTLLRRSASNLHLFDHGARGTLQSLALRPAQTATITSYQRVSALKPAVKVAAKPASTITKPPAKPTVKRPSTYATLSSQTSRTKGAAAAATPTSPEAVAEPLDLSSSTAVEANEIENSTSAGQSNEKPDAVDWSTSFQGVGVAPFSSEASQILMADLSQQDIEIKPDGIVYLPEIKYRRILNRAFGPGGWGMVPRGDLVVEDKIVTREYALIAHGR